MVAANTLCPTKMMCMPSPGAGYEMLGIVNAFKSGSLNPTYINGSLGGGYGYNSGYFGGYNGGVYGYNGFGNMYNPYLGLSGFDNNNQRVRTWEEGQQVRANQLESSQWAGRLANAIVNNETSHIMSFHDKFMTAVRNEDGYKQLRTEGERQAYIEQAYGNIAGQSLESTIDANSDSDIVAGLKNGLSFGLFPKKFKSANTLKEELLGIEKPEGATTVGVLGRIGGGAATGAGVGALLGLCGGPFAPITSSAGAICGAIIGGIGGALSSLWS